MYIYNLLIKSLTLFFFSFHPDPDGICPRSWHLLLLLPPPSPSEATPPLWGPGVSKGGEEGGASFAGVLRVLR